MSPRRLSILLFSSAVAVPACSPSAEAHAPRRRYAQAYYDQSVSAPPGVPVVTNSYPDNPNPGCGFELPDSGSVSGCATEPLLAQISDTLGLPVSSFHGCYGASEFTIAADLSSTSNCAIHMGSAHTAANLCGEPGPPRPSEPAEPCPPAEPAGPPPEPTDASEEAKRACLGLEDLGEHRGYFCAPEFNYDYTPETWCVAAYKNCVLNKMSNPGENIICTFNGQVIYVHETDAGACVGVPSGDADFDPDQP